MGNQNDSERRWFSTTRWTMIMAAKDGAGPAAAEALERLCTTYWFPLYAYARRKGCSPEDAADLTQGLFVRLLGGQFLDGIDPARGKFRSFLRVAMNRHIADFLTHRNAAKRGGGKTISLGMQDAESRYLLEAVDENTPESLFDYHWALSLLGKVTDDLQSEFEESGRGPVFDRLKPFLTGEAERHDYQEASRDLGMENTATRMAVSRMRKRFREILRHEVATTVALDDDIDEELAGIRSILSP
ncbi:MAG: sigma factor [Verrucomicrobiota bacterium]